MQVSLVSITEPSFDGLASTPGQLIAYCARVSNPNNQSNKGTAPKLLKYLVTNGHWSPFEMVSMCLEITTTRDIARQILRHRSFSFQEFSQRYAVAGTEPIFREARLQDEKNRQNSIEITEETLQNAWHSLQQDVATRAYSAYESALAAGIAKEVARAVLPEGMTESKLYMNGTIRSWIHYIQSRTDPSTQKEHREIAEACKAILLEEIPELLEVLP